MHDHDNAARCEHLSEQELTERLATLRSMAERSRRFRLRHAGFKQMEAALKQGYAEQWFTLRSMVDRMRELRLAQDRLKQTGAGLELEFAEFTGGRFDSVSEAIREVTEELRRREVAKKAEAAPDVYEWDEGDDTAGGDR